MSLEKMWLEEMIEICGDVSESVASEIWDLALDQSGVAELRGYRKTPLSTLEGQLYGLRAYMDRSASDPRGYMIGISQRDANHYHTPFALLTTAIRELAKNPPLVRLAQHYEIAELQSSGILLTEEEAKELPSGSLFTGANGQWYIRL